MCNYTRLRERIIEMECNSRYSLEKGDLLPPKRNLFDRYDEISSTESLHDGYANKQYSGNAIYFSELSRGI